MFVLDWSWMPLTSFSHLAYAPVVKIDITHGTCIGYIMARITTPVTMMKAVLSLLNKSKGMLVDGGYISASELNISVVFPWVIWRLFKNTFDMSRIITFFTLVEPMLWVVSFFLTNIAIIFTWVIFSNIITKGKWVLVLFVLYGVW